MDSMYMRWISPATTLAEAGLTSNDTIVMLADRVAPGPRPRCRHVADPAEAPTKKCTKWFYCKRSGDFHLPTLTSWRRRLR